MPSGIVNGYQQLCKIHTVLEQHRELQVYLYFTPNPHFVINLKRAAELVNGDSLTGHLSVHTCAVAPK